MGSFPLLGETRCITQPLSRTSFPRLRIFLFKTATCHSDPTTPSSVLLTPPVSSLCPDANEGIDPLMFGSSDWLTLWLPRMNQIWEGELTELYVTEGY